MTGAVLDRKVTEAGLGFNAQKCGFVHWSMDRAAKDVFDIYHEANLKKVIYSHCKNRIHEKLTLSVSFFD